MADQAQTRTSKTERKGFWRQVMTFCLGEEKVESNEFTNPFPEMNSPVEIRTKVKRMDPDETEDFNSESGYEASVYSDSSGFVTSRDNLPDIYGDVSNKKNIRKRKSKKKGPKSAGSSQGSITDGATAENDPYSVSSEFISIMSGGMSLLVAMANGNARAVTVTVTAEELSWGKNPTTIN